MPTQPVGLTQNLIFVFARPELVKVEKEVEVVLKFPDVDPLNPPVLTMSEIAFRYSADKVIFNCVNLNANLESRICIVSALQFHLIILKRIFAYLSVGGRERCW